MKQEILVVMLEACDFSHERFTETVFKYILYLRLKMATNDTFEYILWGRRL